MAESQLKQLMPISSGSAPVVESCNSSITSTVATSDLTLAQKKQQESPSGSSESSSSSGSPSSPKTSTPGSSGVVATSTSAGGSLSSLVTVASTHLIQDSVASGGSGGLASVNVTQSNVSSGVSTAASSLANLNIQNHHVVSTAPGAQQQQQQQNQKRPMNAFLIFCKRHRSVVKSKYPHLENRSITKILGEWWAALDSDQKQKYTELARQYKEAFMKANPHFKWYKTDNFQPTINNTISNNNSNTNGILPNGQQPMVINNNHHQQPSASQVDIMNSTTGPVAVMSNGPVDHHKSIGIVGNSHSMICIKEGLIGSGSINSIPGSSNLQVGSSSSGPSSASPVVNNNSAVPVVNSTPKPPKKRYLETTEFRSSNVPTTVTSTPISAPTGIFNVSSVVSSTGMIPSSSGLSSVSTLSTSSSLLLNVGQTSSPSGVLSSTSSSTLPVPSAKAAPSSVFTGPPGSLDMDTLNKVIVDALANGPNPAPSTYLNFDSVKTSGSSKAGLTSASSDGVNGDKSDVTTHGTIVAGRSRSGSPMDTSGVISTTSVAQMINRSSSFSSSHPNVSQENGKSSNIISKNNSNNNNSSSKLFTGGQQLNQNQPSDTSSSSSGSPFVSCLTAESLLNAESQQTMGSATKTVAALVSAKHNNPQHDSPIMMNGGTSLGSAPASGIMGPSGVVSTSGIMSAVVTRANNSSSPPDTTPPEDKPLNLSATLELKATNQQIMNHFIVKLFNEGSECGEGNPMPAEMLQTSSSTTTGSSHLPPVTSDNVNSGRLSSTPSPPMGIGSSCHTSVGGVGGSGFVGKSTGGSGHKKVDRSCKGKRYLEMINESKGTPGSAAGGSSTGTKRPKNGNNGSGNGGSGSGGESESPEKSSNKKWVSGGFDLEEHIAALPQLGDAHLVTALNNSKNKISMAPGNLPMVNGNMGSHVKGPNGSGHSHHHHHHHSNHNHQQKGHPGDHHNRRQSDTDSSSNSPKNDLMAGSSDMKTGGINNSNGISDDNEMTDNDDMRQDQNDPIERRMVIDMDSQNERKSPVILNGLPSNIKSGMDSESVKEMNRNLVARELLGAGFSLRNSSQGLEVGPCDGLAALAEVALSQAQAISTSTSS